MRTVPLSGVSRRRMRCLVIGIAVAVTCLVAAVSTPALAHDAASPRPLEESPSRQLMVVDANVLEVFGDADVADTQDMKNFVRRITEQVPYAPDAVLLQEVVGPSAQNVADLMTAATGFNYEIALAPPEDYIIRVATDTEPQLRQETAIVLNTDTVRTVGRGGRIDLDYAKADHGCRTVR